MRLPSPLYAILDRSVSGGLVEFEVMAQKLHGRRKAGNIEAVVGAGIDGDLDRNPLALLARDTPIVAAFGKVAALVRRRPVVELADQDQRRHRHVALETEAGRVEADRCAEFFF